MKTYKSYSDAGHGWVAVKIQELIDLGIHDKVTSFSYVKGKTAYLEEDCDLSLWFKAYVQKFGIEPKMVHKNCNYSPIRSYDRYSVKL